MTVTTFFSHFVSKPFVVLLLAAEVLIVRFGTQVTRGSEQVMANRGGATRPNGPNAGNKICQFKLVLLGESAVGKSSLVLRFVKGQFHEFQESTIGGEHQMNRLGYFISCQLCLHLLTFAFVQVVTFMIGKPLCSQPGALLLL